MLFKIIFLLLSISNFIYCGIYKTVETQHFKFIFLKSDEYFVKSYISYSEDIFAKVSGFFNYKPNPKNKIIVLLKTDSDSQNGMLNPLRSHIEILASPPDKPSYGKSDEYLTFLHELIHFFHSDVNTNFWFHKLLSFFGSDLKRVGMATNSGAITEGIATYLETYLSDGGRGREPNFNLAIKSKMLYNDIQNYSKSRQTDVVKFEGGRNYVLGYILFEYIFENFGAKKFLEFDKYYEKFPFIGEQLAIKKIFGLSPDQLYQNAIDYKKEKYKSFLEIEDGINLSKKSGLASNLLAPVFLKDKIISGQSQSNNYDINEYNLKENKLYISKNILKNVEYPQKIVADEKMEKIVILKNFLSPSKTNSEGMFFQSRLNDVLLLKNNKLKRLTKDKHIFDIAISQDGVYIIGTQKKDNVFLDLVLINEDGSVEKLYSKKDNLIYDLSIDNISKTIVFVEKNENTNFNSDIMMIKYEQDYQSNKIKLIKKIRLTNSPYIKMNPKLIGDNICYSADYLGDLSYYCQNLNDKRIKLVAQDKIGIVDANIVDDKIIYYSMDNLGYTIKTKKVEYKDFDFQDLENKKNIFKYNINDVVISDDTSVSKGKLFSDFAFPIIFFPVLDLINPFGYYGFGLQTIGVSILGDQNLNLKVMYNHPYNQLDFSIKYKLKHGIFNFGYDFLKNYREYNTNQDIIINGVSLGISPVFEDKNSVKHFLNISTGLNFEFYSQSHDRITIVNQMKNLNIIYSNYLSMPFDFSYTLTKKVTKSYLEDTGLSFSILSSTLLTLPTLSSETLSYSTVNGFDINIPMWVFGLGINLYSSYSNNNNADIKDLIKYSIGRSVSSNIVLSNGYYLIFPISIIDYPILNFNIRKISLKLFFDTGFFNNLKTKKFEPINGYYIGGQVDFDLSLNLLPFSVSLGAVIYFDTNYDEKLYTSFKDNIKIFFLFNY